MMSVLPAATAVILALSVLLGGATRQGYLGDVVVQIAACFLVGLTLWASCEPGRRFRLDPLGKAMLAVAGILCLVQLLPIFPGLGVKTLSIPDVAGGTLTVSHSWWSRISLTPMVTWAGMTSALVPVAVFMAVTQCDAAGRVLLWRVILGLGGLALLLGVLQMLQGMGSSLRFYAITNSQSSVGFFANRNHFAAQLYVTLAFSGAWIATTGRQIIQKGAFRDRGALMMGGGIAFLLLLTAGLAMTNSRAGLLIAMGTVLGIGAMTMLSPTQERGTRSRGRGTRIILLLLFLVVLLVAQLSLHQIIGRFQADVAEDLRWPLSLATFGAAFSALPFGTGIGSFVRIYGAIEDPAHLTSEYANRAHNDLAEFLLETGILGGALVVLFLIWFGRHALAAWLAKQGEQDGFQRALQRAATLAIAGLLLHALVDYGLRTTALSALFAVACGFLTRVPPPVTQHSRSAPVHRKKAPASYSPKVASMPPPPLPPSPSEPRPAWGEGVTWPEEWKPASGAPPKPRGE